MASLTVEKPKTGGPGGPPGSNDHFWGGDGNRGGDGPPDHHERLKRYRFGLAIGLASILMLFFGAIVTFYLRHHFGRWSAEAGAYTDDWTAIPLPLFTLALNTLVLAASSLAIEKARRHAYRDLLLAPVLAIPGIAADDDQIPWVGFAISLGVGFLIGQGIAWQQLTSMGLHLASGPSSTCFYVLTGAHAIHLGGGVIALLAASLMKFFRRSHESRHIVVDIAAWYWHVMGALWLFIFAMLALLR